MRYQARSYLLDQPMADCLDFFGLAIDNANHGRWAVEHGNAIAPVLDIAVHVRSTAQVPRLFIYNAPMAMALRGTAQQIALADRLIKESDR